MKLNGQAWGAIALMTQVTTATTSLTLTAIQEKLFTGRFKMHVWSLLEVDVRHAQGPRGPVPRFLLSPDSLKALSLETSRVPL